MLTAVVRVGTASWAVVGADGLLAMPLVPVDDPDAPARIGANLEKTARYRYTLDLRNSSGHSTVRGKVQFSLQRQVNEEWGVAQPDTVSGRLQFNEGDRIAFEVINDSALPLYIDILDFGLTGAVNLLWPPPGAQEPLSPQATVSIGVRPGEEMYVFTPDNFPYVRDPNDSARGDGIETFKLFAAASPLDLTILTQNGYRAADRDRAPVETPLMQLLLATLVGTTRDVGKLPADQEWTTVERAIVLRRV